MTPWLEYNEKNLNAIPEVMGVYQLAHEPESIKYVGRANENLRLEIAGFRDKGYKYFQWVKVPWEKEGFEMHCRLYHHAKSMHNIDNAMHPEKAGDMTSLCPVSCKPVFRCEI